MISIIVNLKDKVSNMNFEFAKENMIKQQIRTMGIAYNNILKAMVDLPRERFVPAGMESLAYADMDIPLAHGQKMLAPQTLTRLLDALNISKTDSVLEIGTGSGYLTAILAKISQMVETADIHEDTLLKAKNTLKTLGIYNVKYQHENWLNHSNGKQYDVIVIPHTLKTIPDSVFEMLKPSGKLVAILDNAYYASAMLFTHNGKNWQSKNLFDLYEPVAPDYQDNSFAF